MWKDRGKPGLIDFRVRPRGTLAVRLTERAGLTVADESLSNVTQAAVAAGVSSPALELVSRAPGRSRPPSRVHSEIMREIMERHRRAVRLGQGVDLDAGAFAIRSADTEGPDPLRLA